MTETERKLAEWIWANPGIKTTALVNICGSNYGWKRSTIFTLIKRMSEKEVVRKEDTHLFMCMDRDAYYSEKMESMLDRYCQSSLPLMLEMYLKDRGISRQDAGVAINLIRKYTK